MIKAAAHCSDWENNIYIFFPLEIYGHKINN